MAVVTKSPIAAAGDQCREFELKALNNKERLVIVKRYLTQVGNAVVRPKYEKSKTVEGMKLGVSNTTCRVVITADPRYCGTYSDAKKAPQAGLRNWLDARKLETLFMMHPRVKASGDREWMEAVATIKADHRESFLKASGIDGFFVKPFSPRKCLLITRYSSFGSRKARVWLMRFRGLPGTLIRLLV